MSLPPESATPTFNPEAQRARLCVHRAGDPGRAEVEAYIREIYRAHYDADVQHFAPELVSLHDADGERVAAAGYRPADAGALFLERYLAAPVDQLLAGDDLDPRSPVSRRQIVEVGHLAASRAGEGRRLILLLGPYLAAQGFQWVVSTLTEELRLLFVRLGIVPLALGVADPAVLGDEARAWGRYYEHRPVVLAGQIDIALQRLARRGAQAGWGDTVVASASGSRTLASTATPMKGAPAAPLATPKVGS